MAGPEQVELWILDQLAGLEFTDAQLVALLSWNVDYREVQALRAAGCPPHLVLEILCPLDGLIPVEERTVSEIVDASIQEHASTRV